MGNLNRIVFALFFSLSLLAGGYAQTGLVGFDDAIAGAAAAVEAKVPRGYEIALTEITAPWSALSQFLSDELESRFSAHGKVKVLTWGKALRIVNDNEYTFQRMVSDKSAVGTGEYLDARVVITGTFDQFSGFSQLCIRAVDVREEYNLLTYRVRIPNNDPILAGVSPQGETRKAPEITENALAYLNQGKDFYAEGNYDQAVAELSKALGINKNLTEAYWYRGNAYYDKADYEKAIADCTEALRIDPNYAAAYIIRGSAYCAKADYERAIADCTEALRINPNYAAAYHSRGSAYAEKKDYERAIADFTAAIYINPIYAAAYRNRGRAYADKGDHERANEDYNLAGLLYFLFN